MSNVAIPPKRRRATRGSATPPTAPVSQNSKTSHLLKMQACAQNSQAELSHTSQPSTPPRTPQRIDQAQSASQPGAGTAASGSKQRSRNNKNRPKNVMTSPAMVKNGRNTPPLTGAQSAGIQSSAKPISTPSGVAYAGATFHASPAPSSLPIPSFYSKSVPDSPGFKGFKALREDFPHTTTSSGPSNPGVQSEESPLDFFFKADRAEKARAQSASSNINSSTATGPFQPPPDSPRTQTPNSTNQSSICNRNSSNGLFAIEMDSPGVSGSPGIPFGPAFSTPYTERINAARASSTSRSRTNSEQATDRSEALKAYLFSGRPLQSPIFSPESNGPVSPIATSTSSSAAFPKRQQYSTFPPHDGKSTNSFIRASGRSSGLRQEVTPTTPTRTPDRGTTYSTSPTPSRSSGHTNVQQSNDYIGNLNSHSIPASPFGTPSSGRRADIQGMEDSLRKILKLDSAGSLGSSSAIGSVPVASVSAPSYVGGRAPPMNGMHNGVMGS